MVTTQALHIVDRLSRRTKLPIWIDAICIPQDNNEEKQKELPKMADIYRGSAVVVGLISEVDSNVCRAVRLSAAIVDTAAYGALEKAGDIHGCFSFVTGVDSQALVNTSMDIPRGHSKWTYIPHWQQRGNNPNQRLPVDIRDHQSQGRVDGCVSRYCSLKRSPILELCRCLYGSLSASFDALRGDGRGAEALSWGAP
ncbi:hypothetical protein BDN71DRAFT_276098 [Pleurotus eryngii]|uniref:Heterokaryon incompatibility domain-containing protein n=1 Tax=Pleurotus eryngii TaxID=5323 RepID=A0A9P6DBY3_PLEER|nr:hypothetical protein BDN71DRAFT_276098 [Pleurotus eryngii]